MDISGWIENAKRSVLTTLEQQVYNEATANNLVDTALKSLVEAAVGKLQIEMPLATSAVSAVLGFLRPLAGAADQLGLDDKLMELVGSQGLDKALQERVLGGLSRYLTDNGGRLMRVALDALVKKLSNP